MWNVRLGHEHAGLDFWLSSIACHAPKAPILVIGTHIDQVEKFWLPAEEIKKRYPQICGFHSVSSYTGDVRILYTISIRSSSIFRCVLIFRSKSIDLFLIINYMTCDNNFSFSCKNVTFQILLLRKNHLIKMNNL